MKRILLLLCLILTIFLSSCGYSKDDLIRAKNEAYQEGFEQGYDLAKYEAKGELERLKDEHDDNAYGAGYEIGYEDGYSDCLDEYGLEDSRISPDGFARIEKD